MTTTASEDHVYLSMITTNPATATRVVRAELSETRTQPILMRPGEYNAAVVKASLPTTGLPIMIWPQPNTTLFVTLSDVSGGPLAELHYPQAVGVPTFTPRIPELAFAVFDVQSVVDVINVAFRLAFDAMIAAHPPANPALGVTSSPWMSFDPDTRLWSLNVSSDYVYNVARTPNRDQRVQVWMSWDLYRRIESFPVDVVRLNSGAPNYRDVNFILRDRGTPPSRQFAYSFPPDNAAPPLDANFWPTGPTGSVVAWPGETGGWLRITQSVATNALSDFTTIFIQASGMQLAQNNLAVQAGGGFDSGGQPIIFTMLIDLLTDSSSYYTPPGSQTFVFTSQLYRLVPMFGSIPLNQLNFSVHLLSRTGQQLPLFLMPGSSAQLSMVFVRKGLPS